MYLSLSPSLFSRAPIYVLDIVQVTEDDGSAYSFFPSPPPLAWHAAKGLTAVTPIRRRREDEKRISVFHISLFIKKKEEKLSAPNPFVNGFCHCHGVGKKRKKSRPFFFFFYFHVITSAFVVYERRRTDADGLEGQQQPGYYFCCVCWENAANCTPGDLSLKYLSPLFIYCCVCVCVPSDRRRRMFVFISLFFKKKEEKK